jgi:hypothetical protein
LACSAADDVTKRSRKAVAAERTAEVLIQRDAEHVGAGFRRRHRRGNRAVRADGREVVGAVGRVECGIDGALVADEQPLKSGHGVFASRRNRLRGGQFDGLVLAG